MRNQEEIELKYQVYLSIGAENKISTFKMLPDTGKLLFEADVAVGGAPGPLAVDPERKFLYAGIRSTREISSFRIDQSTGSRTQICK